MMNQIRIGFGTVDFEVEAVGEKGCEIREWADGEETVGRRGVQSPESKVQSR